MVIVSYRTPDLVFDCAHSAIAAGATTVVVVDNASGDGTVAELSDVDGVTVLANSHNRGYGAAANQGLAATTSPVVLIANGDTLIPADLLHAIDRRMADRPEVALMGPTIRRTDGSLQHSTFPFPSIADSLIGETGLQLLIGRTPWLRERFLRTWSHDRPRAVDWVVGAAFAVRRAAMDEVGGFDEDYFMYSEEVDLCRRLADRGHLVEYAPVGVVTHVGEASAVQDAENMARRRQQSAVRFLRSHETPARARRLLALLRCISALRYVRDVVFTLVGPPEDRPRRRREAQARWSRVRERELWTV